MASYEQNEKNKKWSVRFRCTIDGKEVNKRLSGYRTKKEAQAAYIEFESNQKELEKQRSTINKEDILFVDLANKYLEHQKTRIKESSYITILSKINNHIIPYFKDKSMSEITPLFVLEWQHSINHYAYEHKSALRSQLSSIYKYGERYFNVTNIMGRVEPFRNTEAKKEMSFWTLDEFNTFISCCEEETYILFFKFLYITGCRRGEALALTWNDIDFSNQNVKISKNLTRKTSDGAWKIVTPKNVSSNRNIDLPLNFCKELSAFKKQSPNTHFIFGSETPLHENKVSRIFKLYTEKANLKPIRIHDIRHSCASLLISQGISIVAVSHRLGHKNIEQTLNTYSHLMPNESQKMISIFEGI